METAQTCLVRKVVLDYLAVVPESQKNPKNLEDNQFGKKTALLSNARDIHFHVGQYSSPLMYSRIISYPYAAKSPVKETNVKIGMNKSRSSVPFVF